MSEPVLRARGIAIQFGGNRALDGVSLTLEEGEVVGLVGPNGAGKTALLNIITGVYRPTEGSVEFRGKGINGFSAHKIAWLGIARTFQNLRMFGSLSVMEHALVAIHSSRSNVWAAASREKKLGSGGGTVMGDLRETLEAFGLWDLRQQTANQLPYGFQRRLEIVRALGLRPSVLLLDEPVAGMTDEEAKDLSGRIRELAARGLSVLLIEHHMPFVAETCEKVLVINFGKEVTWGTPQHIRSHPAVLEAYLGEDHE